MHHYVIRNATLKLFNSYLENRKQGVCVDKERSSEEWVNFRVPQGSLMGPLLFVVMINDLLYLLNSHSKLHIDDTNFLNTSTYFRLLKITTKNTLYQAVVWFRSNGFKLNVKKTQHMVFSLR